MNSQPAVATERRSLPPPGGFLAGIWFRRHLVWSFVLRDLKERYAGSLMGFFWAIVHPLALLLAFSFVFSVVFQVRPVKTSADNFAVFLFCGILPWLYFQDTVQRSCQSVVQNSNLLRKTLFPAEILPLTAAIANLFTHWIGVGILLTFLLYLGTPGRTLPLLGLYFLLLALLALGLGWLCAALQVFVRDTAQVLSVALILWFWFTPVFYQVEMVPQPYQILFQLNPMAHVVEGYRSVLLENRLPDPRSLALLCGYAALSIGVGGWVFRRTRREFVDVL